MRQTTNPLRARTLLLLLVFLSSSLVSQLHGQSLQEVNARVKQVQALEATGKFSEATQEYKKILAGVEATYGTESDAASDVLHMVALSLQNEGKQATAEPFFLKSIRIKEKIYPPPYEVAITGRLSNLSALYKQMGRYDEAEPLQLRALKIRELRLPPDDINIAASLNNLGNLYNELGRYSECEPLYKRTLKIVETKLGPNHEMTATILNNIGRQYKEQQKLADAEPYYLRSLQIREQLLGRDAPLVGLSLQNLALLYFEQERYSEVEPLLLRNLKIQETALGVDHPDVASCLTCLAYLCQSEKRFAEGEANYKRSIQILEKKFGDSHPLCTSSAANLGVIQGQRQQWTEAVTWMDRARRGIRRHVAAVLPSLSEKQQQDFLETDKRNIDCCLSLGLKAPEQLPIVEATATWLSNAKGVGHTALVEQALTRRNVGDANLMPLVDELLAVRRRLATLRLTVVAADQEATQKAAVQELETKERDLSRKLPQIASQNSAQNEWVELGAIRAALPPDGVLIDIARIKVFKFSQERLAPKDRFLPEHYVAWIVPPAGKGNVQIVDLGLADAMDAVVAKARESIAAEGLKSGLGGKKGQDAEQKVREDLQRVADLLWKPLADKLGGAKRLTVSPDGTLWLLPWSTLPTSDDKYLVEQYPLHFVIRGRDLIPHPALKLGMSKPAIFADPDFDLSPEKTRQSILAMFPNHQYIIFDFTRSLSEKLLMPAVSRLPNTAVEAERVSPNIERLTHIKPQAYTDRYALESVVKKVQRPSILLLSTHGFFLPDQDAKAADFSILGSESRGAALTTDGKPVENPLLRCGLLFTGCNGKKVEFGDDGVLNGMEIAGIDLRETELVVLSACETGIGKIRNGEGVAGLRQAFQMAGAKSVVATLWQVPDRDSAIIMDEFFSNLADGQQREDALRSAQLKRIETRRDKFGDAHPYYWAAWTLTGD